MSAWFLYNYMTLRALRLAAVSVRVAVMLVRVPAISVRVAVVLVRAPNMSVRVPAVLIRVDSRLFRVGPGQSLVIPVGAVLIPCYSA